MATIFITCAPRDALPLPGIPFPAYAVDATRGGGGASTSIDVAFPFPYLSFPASQLSAAYWQFPVGVVGAAAPQVQANYYTSNAGSGTARFVVQVGVQNNGTVDTRSLDSVQNPFVMGTGSTPGVHANTGLVVLTNVNGFGSGSSGALVTLKLARNGNAANDSVFGDLRIRSLQFSFSDT